MDNIAKLTERLNNKSFNAYPTMLSNLLSYIYISLKISGRGEGVQLGFSSCFLLDPLKGPTAIVEVSHSLRLWSLLGETSKSFDVSCGVVYMFICATAPTISDNTTQTCHLK